MLAPNNSISPFAYLSAPATRPALLSRPRPPPLRLHPSSPSTCVPASLRFRTAFPLTDPPSRVDTPDARASLSARGARSPFHRDCRTAEAWPPSLSIVPLTNRASPASTERNAQKRSTLCYGACTTPRASPHCSSHFATELESAGDARNPSRPEVDLAGSGGRSVCPPGRGRGREVPGPDPMDIHFQRILQTDPQNPLLLRNYAQFLSQTKLDYRRAEELYERAILACPSDGEVVSMYARHIWDKQRDAERAGSYFDRALQAAPDNRYILGSYASFLWESEDHKH